MYLDVAIYNAKVYTMSPRCPWAQAVGIKGDRVLIVGNNEEIRRLCSDSTKQINAQQQVMLPGFIDAHTHFRSMGVSLDNYLDLRSATSKLDLLQRLKLFVKKKEPRGWVIGTGWDESKWSGDRTFITKEEIDAAVSHLPVTLERIDGHLYCVNGQALDMLNLDESVRGFEIAEGKPTGRLFEDATARVRKAIKADQEQSITAIKRATRHAYRHGVTSIHQMVVEEEEFRDDLKSYQNLWSDNQLGIRARLYFTPNVLHELIAIGLSSGFGDNKLRIGGLKLFTDGSIGAKTAWVTEGYRDNPENKGMAIWDREELEPLMKKSDDNGIQLAIHAIGTQALEQVITCLEAILRRARETRLRHRIEHDEMLTRDQIKRVSRLKVITSMQPNFTGQWGLPGEMYEERFGQERMKTMNPLRWIVNSGITLAFGSDCMPFGPLYGIHWAVNAPFESQRLSVAEALRAYTMGGAFAGNAEHEVGSIEPGKLADLILLDENPFLEPASIKDMKVQLTIFDGQVVYQANTQ